MSSVSVLAWVRIFVSQFQDIKVGEGGGEQWAGPKLASQGSSRLTAIISRSILVALAYFASPIYCK